MSGSNEVHVTDRQAFKACRRMWGYRNREHLQPVKESTGALWLGKGIHVGMETYYTGGDAIQGFRSWLDQKVSADDISKMWPDEKFKLNEIITLAETMLTRYIDFAKKHDDFEVVDVEKTLRVQVPNTKYYLVGTLDLLVRRKGKLWIVDHKSYQQFVDPTDLELDDQMTAYMWLVSQVYGEMPGGAIYNQLRKKIPTEPKVLKSGGLSKDKGIDTTYEKYLEAINTNGLDPNDYQDILEKLKHNQYFKRELIARNANELKTFGLHLTDEVTDMMNPNLPLYPNPTRDCQWRCADYRSLCKCQNEGGDIEYFKDRLYVIEEGRRA